MTILQDRSQLLLSHFDALAQNDLETFLAQLPHPVLLVGPGARLGRLDEVTSKVPTTESDTVALELGQRNDQTLVIPVAKRFTAAVADIIWLGRAVTCDVVMPFETVSKIHAVISHDSKRQLVVSDVGSKNGSWLNQVRLEQGQQTPLQDQDLLRLGNIDARFLFPESLYLYLQTDAHT